MATIGQMNVPIEYQTMVATDDGAGGTTAGTWTTQFSFMGSVEPLRGYRRFEFSQIIKGNGYIVQTHYRQFSNKGRLKLYDGTIINIHSVINTGFGNQYIEIVGDDGR